MLVNTNYQFEYFAYFRLFYAGACEGQMPEILSMIQVNKMTPAPAVLVVVRSRSLTVQFYFILIPIIISIESKTRKFPLKQR